MEDTVWRFAPSLGSSRIANLKRLTTIHDIAEQLRSRMEHVCAHWRESDDSPGHWRAIYCFRVAAPLFDLFFNSASGYRGAYFASPNGGREANAFILSRLSEPLIASSSLRDGPVTIRSSLEAASAKMWLAERETACCQHCGEWQAPGDTAPEIFNGRWEVSEHTYAGYGRKAPNLTLIRVFGGFVNPIGEEYFAPHKRNRAQQLYDWGWS